VNNWNNYAVNNLLSTRTVVVDAYFITCTQYIMNIVACENITDQTYLYMVWVHCVHYSYV